MAKHLICNLCCTARREERRGEEERRWGKERVEQFFISEPGNLILCRQEMRPSGRVQGKRGNMIAFLWATVLTLLMTG